jgi:hypothetical protein
MPPLVRLARPKQKTQLSVGTVLSNYNVPRQPGRINIYQEETAHEEDLCVPIALGTKGSARIA